MTPVARLLVLAKAPVAGRVKTRLMPIFSAQEAAELAEAALSDTLAAVDEAVVLARWAGVPVEPLLVLDGTPGGWLPSTLRVLPQADGGLDVRLADAFDAGSRPVGAGDDAVDAPPLPCLLIGMDTPQVSASILAETLLDLVDPVSGTGAHLGPAADGGWWALGLREPDPALLLGLPMSTPSTFAATRRRLVGNGVEVRELPLLTDVDTARDAALVALRAPGTTFAQVYRTIREAAS